MCECGCTSSDDLYTLPGPNGTLYVITLSRACVNCDGPSGVTIQHCKPKSFLFGWVSEPDTNNGELPLADWKGSRGVVIKTGMMRHEFIAAMQKHLIGIDSNELGEDGKIDEDGADVIAEEMYEDAQMRPTIC